MDDRAPLSDFLVAVFPAAHFAGYGYTHGSLAFAIHAEAFESGQVQSDEPLEVLLDDETDGAFVQAWTEIEDGIFESDLEIDEARQWFLDQRFVLSGPFEHAIEAQWVASAD